MQKSRHVHRVQAVEQRQQDAQQEFLIGLGNALQHLAQRHARLVIHHHVGGAVGLEITADGDDVRVAELGEQARFLQKAVQAPLVVVLGTGADGDDTAIQRAHRELYRQVLLDCYLEFEVGVVGEVGHAETARPEYRFQPVLEQHRAGRQRVSVIQYFDHL